MNQQSWGLVTGIMFVLGMLSFMIKGEGSVVVRLVKLILLWLGVVGGFSLCVILWLMLF